MDAGRSAHGSCWNRGARHMNHAFSKAFFDRLRSVSMPDAGCYLQRHW